MVKGKKKPKTKQTKKQPNKPKQKGKKHNTYFSKAYRNELASDQKKANGNRLPNEKWNKFPRAMEVV